MVAITTPDSHKFPWYVRLFFWNQKRRYGAPLEPALKVPPQGFCAVAAALLRDDETA